MHKTLYNISTGEGGKCPLLPMHAGAHARCFSVCVNCGILFDVDTPAFWSFLIGTGNYPSAIFREIRPYRLYMKLGPMQCQLKGSLFPDKGKIKKN